MEALGLTCHKGGGHATDGSPLTCDLLNDSLRPEDCFVHDDGQLTRDDTHLHMDSDLVGGFHAAAGNQLPLMTRPSESEERATDLQAVVLRCERNAKFSL